MKIYWPREFLNKTHDGRGENSQAQSSVSLDRASSINLIGNIQVVNLISIVYCRHYQTAVNYLSPAMMAFRFLPLPQPTAMKGAIVSFARILLLLIMSHSQVSTKRMVDSPARYGGSTNCFAKLSEN